MAAARDAARSFAGKEKVTVHVGDGTYYLPETLVLAPQDSGTANLPVVYHAVNEGKAVISGGRRLELTWQPGENGIFKAATPAGLTIDQLFINGRGQRMARYPDHDANKPTAAYQGYSADAISKERAARWADPAGGYIHAMHSARWGGYHYRITGKKPDGNVAYEGGWQNNRQMGMHKDFRMVENIFEELDAPGEWFHQAKTNTLSFIPEPGVDPRTSVVEVVRLRHLIEFRGSPEAPVRHVTFAGFTFRHAARTFMDTREPLLRSDWTIYRGGAVMLDGTEDVSILDSVFDQVGGNAVFVNNYNRRALIRGCHIHDAGASGVCFVGDPAAVRDPLFEYGQKNDIARIDRTPGPKTSNYPADSVVEDCLIHGIGRVERQPAGVQISMAHKIAVRDTSIYDCSRSGINISEGTWGGHLIERCDVFDTVLETHDHGSFNSWGRDRFWASNHREFAEAQIALDPGLPFLDAIATIVIRDSRWRCDHGWDIDLDDGSSNYEIHNNLMLAGGLKFREGFRRKAYNNILINNGLHPHVWHENSESTFRHNIVMRPPAPVRQPEDWTEGVDFNFFPDEAALRASQRGGTDRSSLAGDPKFVDPAAGDFRVADDSPALKTGFRNFPMDQFGVKKPSLRAIAKTPEIPALNSSPVTGASAGGGSVGKSWLGAALHGLLGEEFSAFGVSKEDGGVQLLKVPEGSPAANAGFKSNDLVQSVNGRRTPDIQHLLAALVAAGSAPLELRVVRNQLPMVLKPKDLPYLAVESAHDASGFRKLAPQATSAVRVSASVRTNNDPLAVLTDGRLANSYGPVFANGVVNGSYKLDLGRSQPISAVNSWSFNQNGKRARQRVDIFGSNSSEDPGWNTADASKFTPLGSLDTGVDASAGFVAASLRVPEEQALGTFRWIVWACEPVSGMGENTAWQEFSVEHP